MVDYDTDAKVVIEDLVQLHLKQRDPQRLPSLTLPRIQHIYFLNPSEIPSLLATRPVMNRPDLRADVPATVPQVAHVPQTEGAKDEEKTQVEEPEVEPAEEESHEEPQELTLTTSELVPSHEPEPTEEEILAAEKIQAAYRMYRKYHEARTRAVGKGLEAQRNTIFIACLKNVYASGWGRTPYRTLYLWALPRLIVCLDEAISVAHEFKNKTKGLFSKENHERLEELGKRMTMIK